MSTAKDPSHQLMRALEAFQAYQDQPDRWADEGAFLDDPNHSDLRSILEGLIAVPDSINDLQQTVDFKVSSSPPHPSSSPPEQIGPYRLLEPLGEGGFGVVYRAEQRGKVRRTVALKIIKKGMDTKQVLARFDAEKNALSLMNHPNIARVIDSGETDDGQPYFVMEYVDGTPITTYCHKEKLSLEERLRLFQQVCRGVQHAHSKAIVHRDLKPANIIVTRVDGKAVPKIIDFGLVKALGGALTEMTVVTQQRQILGTLEYMSPEQARSGGSDIDTKTDIYALGVILYELLVNVRPFDLQRIGDLEILRIIEEEDPPRPSLRYSSLGSDSTEEIATARGLNSKRLSQLLNNELDWIVLKALEKKRERRYETPLEIAADLERHLVGHEPVEARPPSVSYRVKKFSRRYRATLTATLFVFAALTAGISWALVERDQAQKSEQRAIASQQEAIAQKELAEQAKIEAEEQKEIAQQKSDQLQQVADFQGERLSAIDPQSMGWGIRQMLIAKVIETPQNKILNEEDQKKIQETLEKQIAGIDFTGLALTTLETEFFQRTLGAIEALDSQPLIQAQLFHAIGQTLYKLGLVSLSQETLEKVLKIYNTNLEPLNPKMFTVLNDIGSIFYLYRDFEKAEELLKRAYEGRKKVLGEHDPATLHSLHNLAAVYADLGNTQVALEILHDLLVKQAEVVGPLSVDTLATINTIGSVYSLRSEYEQANTFFERALKGRREALGEHHPDIVNSLNNLGNSYHVMGEKETSLSYLREALKISILIHGGGSPNTASIHANLAFVLSDSETIMEAAFHHEKAYEIWFATYGPLHEFSLTEKNNLGTLFYNNGKYKEALEAFTGVLENYRQAVGMNNRNSIEIVHKIGLVHKKLQNYDKSEEFLNDALNRRVAFFGQDALELLHSFIQLADLYYLKNEHVQAMDLLKRAIRISEIHLGENHEDTLFNHAELGIYSLAAMDFLSAGEAFFVAENGFLKIKGPRHPYRLMAMQYRVVVLTKQKKWTEALELAEALVQLTDESDRINYENRTALLKEIEAALLRNPLQSETTEDQNR